MSEKRTLSAELKEKLKGLGGFNANDTLKIVPTEYKTRKIDPEYWPTFTFKYLSAFDVFEFQKVAAPFLEGDQPDHVLIAGFTNICDLIDKFIISVENFYNIDTGEEIQIDGRKSISYLPSSFISDFCVQLLNNNQLIDEEREALI